MAMATARTLSALLIALSIALLPVASAAARIATSAEMSMPDGGDCCPNAVQPCDMTKDGCLSMAACGLLTSTLSEPAILAIAFPLVAASAVPLPAEDALVSRGSGPPLHPPQI